MLNRLLLTLLAVFAVSSPALAYPLNPYQVVWPFEGHSTLFTPEHAITGELRFSDSALGPTVILTVYADGDPTPISGFVNATIVDGQISGSDGGFYAVSPAIPFEGLLRIDLNYNDPLEEGSVDPNGFFLPPSYASDIGLFSRTEISSYYKVCMDVGPLGTCASGGGLRYDVPTFVITIDRFLDPVPEPSSLALGALTLIAIRKLRRAARR